MVSVYVQERILSYELLEKLSAYDKVYDIYPVNDGSVISGNVIAAIVPKKEEIKR